MVTRGAVAVPATERRPDLAERGGVGPGPQRAVRAPRPRPRWSTSTTARRLGAGALLAGRDEPQLALRGGACFAPRLARAGADASSWPPRAKRRLAAGDVGKGTLDGTTSVAASDGPNRGRSAPGEVRSASAPPGLNFRDVLIALGMYPGEAPLGSEGAGVVLEVGAGVPTWRPATG